VVLRASASSRGSRRGDAGGKGTDDGALRRLQANHELVDTQHQALATLKINGTRGWMVFSPTPGCEERYRLRTWMLARRGFSSLVQRQTDVNVG